jgi:putative ABC transport system permease protein
MPLAAGTLSGNQVPAGKVVVPEDYLGVLGFKNAQDAVGKTITVHFEKPAQFAGQRNRESIDKVFTVAAVDKKSNTVLHYQTALRISPDDGKSIYEFQTADQADKDQYFMVNVRVRDGADVKAVQKSIEGAGYTVFSLQDVQETLFQFINIVQWGTAGFGALAILASIFGIINTQYISVLERTQQIGLMKALGMRSRDVAALFRYEAAWIGFLGGAIGVSLAFIAGTVFNPIIQKALELGEGTDLLIFQPLVVLGLMTALILIAITAGYFPARKAAKLDPIEALRTE